MHAATSFIASAAPSVSQLVAGGSYALPNPAASNGATALLLSAPAGGPVFWRFAADATQAPAFNDPSRADGRLDAGGMVLLTDSRALTAPFIVVSGVLSATPGVTTTALNVNS